MRKRIKADRSHYLFDNRALTLLIVPLIIEQLLAVLVGLADSIMAASVGEAAVSGVALVDNIMILLINIFAALATGGAVVAGQYLGQKRVEKAREASTQLVWFITILAIGITMILYICKDLILHKVFGQIDQDVMGYANTYMIIVSASIPFLALYNGGAAIFRAMGNSGVSMKVSALMNVINVSGNAILIYGFHCGTEGVAIPTLVSRAVAAIVITIMLCNRKHPLHLERSWRYHPNLEIVGKELAIGVPNGMENSMFQLGKIIVLSLVSTFGTYAITANAVSNSVAMFLVLPGLSITLAITTVIARCVGAGDYEQVHYYTKKLIAMVYVGLLITNGLLHFLLPWILRLYQLSPKTAEATQHILRFYSCMAILIWPLSFAMPAVFRAAGDAKMCMIISIVSMWIFRVIFSYIIGEYMGWEVFGVWVAMVIDWIFRSICFIIRYKGGRWKKAAIV